MGCFSWCTSDTKQEVRNVLSGKCRTVFLLQPDGEHIREDAYEGYGVFGGQDAFEWLTKWNVPVGKLPESAWRDAGIFLDGAEVLKLPNGEYWSIFGRGAPLIAALELPVKVFTGRWDEVIPEVGESADDLLNKGLAVYVNAAEEFDLVKYPLKFSFDAAADYDLLPPALGAPNQGF